MKRISDCCEVSTPGKQHILTSNLSNRESLNESLIMEYDQASDDYEFVTKALEQQRRSSRNGDSSSSRVITATQNTTKSLAQTLEEYGNFPLPNWMTAAILRDVAKALLQLHSNQVIHGSVKTENIYFMDGESAICLLTNRAHARKIDPHRLTESRAEDFAQLGSVLFRCLTGFEVGPVDLSSTPFSISQEGVILASKMMARKFSESAHYIINHSFVTENTKISTARFLKLT